MHKLLITSGVISILGDLTISKRCYLSMVSPNVIELDNRRKEKVSSCEPTMIIFLSKEEPRRTIVINAALKENEKEAQISLLHEYVDVFEWPTIEMHGISKQVGQHHFA